jgi:hypothetical protein
MSAFGQSGHGHLPFAVTTAARVASGTSSYSTSPSGIHVRFRG